MPQNIQNTHSQILKSLIREHISEHPVVPVTITPQLPTLSGIKALVFDVYGTLLSSGAGDISTNPVTKLSTRAHSLQVGSQNYSLLELKEFFFAEVVRAHKKLLASGVSHPEIKVPSIWASIFKEKLNLTEEEIFEHALHYELLVNPTKAMPHASDTIKVLHSKGFKLGIVSNAQFFTPMLLEVLLPDAYSLFTDEYCVWSYQEGVAKPDPKLFTKLCSALICNPNEILFVGNDMKNDIWCAQQCGLKTALFAGDTLSYRPRVQDPLVKKTKPDCVVTNFDQLMQCLAL